MRTFDPFRASVLPEELVSRAQWVLWKTEKRKGKATKVPYSIHGRKASTTDPGTWASFDDVLQAYEKRQDVEGIGFVFVEEDGLIGIDLDNAKNGDGQPAGWAAEHLEKCRTYTEVSPSGEGYHIIGIGSLPDGQGRKNNHLEIYDRGRYFTITGRLVRTEYDKVCPVQEHVHHILETVFDSKRLRGPRDFAEVKIVVDSSRTPPLDKYEAMRAADNRFRKTVDRNRADMKDSSPSAYDMSLASIVARAGWLDQEIADLLIYTRVKHGDDVKRKDYYQRTIHKARVDLDVNEAIDTLVTMSGDESSGLDAIKKITNLNIKRIIQDGKRDSQWIVEFEDGERHVMGTTADVCSKAKWQNLVMEMRAGSLGNVTKKQWEKFKESVQRVAVLEENSQASFHIWLSDIIDGYLEGVQGEPVTMDCEDFEESFRQARPFLDKEDCLHISAESLGRYLFQGGDKVDRKKIYSGLRALGYQNVSLVRRIEGRLVKRNYWKFVTS